MMRSQAEHHLQTPWSPPASRHGRSILAREKASRTSPRMYSCSLPLWCYHALSIEATDDHVSSRAAQHGHHIPTTILATRRYPTPLLHSLSLLHWPRTRVPSSCLPVARIDDACRMLSWYAYRVEEAAGDSCRPSTWPPGSLLTDGGRRDMTRRGRMPGCSSCEERRVTSDRIPLTKLETKTANRRRRER